MNSSSLMSPLKRPPLRYSTRPGIKQTVFNRTINTLKIHINKSKETEQFQMENNIKYKSKTGLQQPTEAKISA